MARRARGGGLRFGRRSTTTPGVQGGAAAGGVERAATRGGEHSHHHHRPWLIPLAAGGGVLIVMAAAAAAVVLFTPGPPQPTLPKALSSTPASSLATSDGIEATGSVVGTGSLLTTGSVDVEVPDVVGKTVAAAESVLKAAGFTMVTRVAPQATAGVAADVVLAQEPTAGSRTSAGHAVTITYNPLAGMGAGTVQPVVLIDAGHQKTPDLTPEPIGPGSTETKEKVKGGATGVFTKVPEYRQVLEISLRLRDRLQAAGLKVVMVRTTDDVNIANSKRAMMGNQAGAALAVRVHLDSNADSKVRGFSTLYPSGNTWVKPIEAESKRAAGLVQAAAVKATGAADRGLFGRADMTGFNYSKVPTIIVECAFMSNKDDDVLAATPAYQEKLAAGITAGVLQYLGR
jgi:N-acetylmuramoyl-L-alanine amidase